MQNIKKVFVISWIYGPFLIDLIPANLVTMLSFYWFISRNKRYIRNKNARCMRYMGTWIKYGPISVICFAIWLVIKIFSFRFIKKLPIGTEISELFLAWKTFWSDKVSSQNLCIDYYPRNRYNIWSNCLCICEGYYCFGAAELKAFFVFFVNRL